MFNVTTTPTCVEVTLSREQSDAWDTMTMEGVMPDLWGCAGSCSYDEGEDGILQEEIPEEWVAATFRIYAASPFAVTYLEQCDKLGDKLGRGCGDDIRIAARSLEAALRTLPAPAPTPEPRTSSRSAWDTI